MRYFPAFLDLQGRSVVVIGGGRVAERKVLTLLACGARVTVISPRMTPKLTYLARAGGIRHYSRSWRPADFKEAILIMATTDDRKANAEIARRAHSNFRLVNIADDPARCNVIMPSVIKRGDLIIAVSTSGKSPSLARRIRRELDGSFGAEYGKFLRLLGAVRQQVQSRVPSMARRRRILQRLAGSDLLALMRKGNQKQLRRRVREIVGLKDLTLKI